MTLPAISGSLAFALIKELKVKYGVKQKSIADVLGISRQAVTDMKAERRRFTKEMAEKLIKEYADEPWADWLRSRLDGLFASMSPDSPVAGKLPHNSVNTAMETNVLTTVPLVHGATRQELPVLTSPCKGNPMESLANTGKSIVLPDELYAQTAERIDSYVLVIGFDGGDGRLRRGDRVLVLQDPERECEIMVVEYRGALRLARRGKYVELTGHGDVGIGNEMDWVLLDSGTCVPEHVAEKVGCVVGIVMALL